MIHLRRIGDRTYLRVVVVGDHDPEPTNEIITVHPASDFCTVTDIHQGERSSYRRSQPIMDL